MPKQSVHVVPHKDKWILKLSGEQGHLSYFPTQKDAITRGKNVARNLNTELFIHRPDGRIRDRNSYGNDPYPPIG